MLQLKSFTCHTQAVERGINLLILINYSSFI